MKFQRLIRKNDDDLLGSYCEQSLEIELHPLTVIQNQAPIAEGWGYIRTDKIGNLYADMRLQIQSQPKRNIETGKILGPESEVIIQAKDVRGRSFTFSSFAPISSQLTNPPDFKHRKIDSWRLYPALIRISENPSEALSSLRRNHLRCVIPNITEIAYPNLSIINYGHVGSSGEEIIDGSSHQRDCLELEVGDAHYHLQSNVGDYCELEIWSTSEADLKENLDNFLIATSFMAGREIFPTGYTYSKSGSIETTLFAAQQKKPSSKLIPPVPQSSSVDVIISMVQFLESNSTSQESIVYYLRNCWHTADCPDDVRNLTICASIEGIANNILDKRKSKTKEEVDFKAAKKKLIETVRADQTQTPVYNRLIQSISNLPYFTARQAIAEAACVVDVPFTKKEIDCWIELRNGPAHGEKPELPPQKLLDSQRRCICIFYKLLLGQIGYRGHYNDYTKRSGLGWYSRTPDVRFKDEIEEQ